MINIIKEIVIRKESVITRKTRKRVYSETGRDK